MLTGQGYAKLASAYKRQLRYDRFRGVAVRDGHHGFGPRRFSPPDKLSQGLLLMNKAARHCPGPVTRRTALKLGTLGLGGLSLADVWRLRADAATLQSLEDRSVIFVWLPGGPPQMEMYDLKPNAPSEYRGEFRPIRSTVPGMDVSEHLPLHAKTAHHYNIIRSVGHTFADHGGGHKRFMTARDPKEPTGTINDYPAVPSQIAKVFENRQRGLPNYVCECDSGRRQIDTFAFGSAYLGNAVHPFNVIGDPSDPKYKVENLAPLSGLESRLEDRAGLLEKFDTWRRQVDKTGEFDSLDKFNSQALELVTSDQAPQGIRPDAGARWRCAIAMAGIRLVSGPCWRGGWSRQAARS